MKNIYGEYIKIEEREIGAEIKELLLELGAENRRTPYSVSKGHGLEVLLKMLLLLLVSVLERPLTWSELACHSRNKRRNAKPALDKWSAPRIIRYSHRAQASSLASNPCGRPVAGEPAEFRGGKN
jgi:hypothetical protein